MNCIGLTGVTLPSSGLTTIGRSAFENCSGLTAVSLPRGLIRIGEKAFRYSGIKQASLPDTVTTLGASAFEGSPMTSLKLSKALEEIPDGCFRNCASLKGSIAIPEGVTGVGKEAFAGCPLLQAVTCPGTLEQIGERIFGKTAPGKLSVTCRKDSPMDLYLQQYYPAVKINYRR